MSVLQQLTASNARRTTLGFCLALMACGPAQTHVAEVPPVAPMPRPTEEPTLQEAAPIPAPPSGTARDISFPPITRVTLGSGLEVNTVHMDSLPVVYLRLVMRSGAETDPRGREGLSDMVAQMMLEGTRHHSSAEIAESIEFLGADISAQADEENLTLVFRALADQLDEALDILAELVTEPAFPEDELAKLKRRQLESLAHASQNPGWLARREMYRRLYGAGHPYAHTDTNEAAIGRIRRRDLVSWHRSHIIPNNAFLVAVGDVTPEQVQASAARAFTRWRRRRAPRTRALPAVPERDGREVIIVDRPGSAQATIFISNVAIARSDDDFVPLDVANQVLGGSAASRLFMDLRERRSLTYGAYSDVGERVGVAPFLAMAAVRTPVTEAAMSGLFEHLDRIVAEAPSQEEVTHATTYLSDSFPLSIDTPAKIAWMVGNLRIFELDDNYWDGYRTAIRATTPADALAAAQAHITPDDALVIVVGNAADIAEPLRTYGPVTVINVEGEVQAELEAVVPTEPPGSTASPTTPTTTTTPPTSTTTPTTTPTTPPGN